MGSQEAAALGGLVAALEQAALMAKQLPTSTTTTTTLDHSQILQIYSYLHTANHHLTLFLSHHSPPPSLSPFQPNQPSFLPAPPPAPPPPALPENSVSSAVGGGDDNDIDPMQMGGDDDDDDDEVEHNSKNTCTSTAAAIEIEGVEERMRDCFIQNKRPKRPLSPSSVAAVAEQRRSYFNEVAAVRGGFLADQFDPEGTRLRSLDLIYQFHG